MLWIAGIIVFILALLAVPLELKFTVRREESFRGEVWFRWLFGAVEISRELGGKAEYSKARAAAEKKTQRKKRTKKKRRSARRILAVLRSEGFVRRVLQLVRDLWRSLHVRVAFQGRLGLDDPADTGRLWGVLGPLNGVLAGFPFSELSLVPDFEKEVFRFQGTGQIRIVPVQLLIIVTLFMFSPAVWKAIWPRNSAVR